MKIVPSLKTLPLAVALLGGCSTFAMAEPKVVSSIKPVHSLVSAVMAGLGESTLLVNGASSPHNFSLKPSQATALQEADVVFWVSDELETFLVKPMETIATNAHSVELMATEGMLLLEFEDDHDDDEDNEHHDHGDEDNHEHKHEHEHEHEDHEHDEDHSDEEHSHDDHGHDDHDHKDAHADDEHDHQHKHGHGHEDEDHEHGEMEESTGHDGHHHGAMDPHIWLDPINAKVMVDEITYVLSELDVENASIYEANANAVKAKLDALLGETMTKIAPLQGAKFATVHDAYGYFENRFGIEASGFVHISPEVAPGAEHLEDLREEIEEAGISCLFSEPQFNQKVVDSIVDDMGIETGVLDPLGAELDDGPELYFELIRGMTTTFQNCL